MDKIGAFILLCYLVVTRRYSNDVLSFAAQRRISRFAKHALNPRMYRKAYDIYSKRRRGPRAEFGTTRFVASFFFQKNRTLWTALMGIFEACF